MSSAAPVERAGWGHQRSTSKSDGPGVDTSLIVHLIDAAQCHPLAFRSLQCGSLDELNLAYIDCQRHKRRLSPETVSTRQSVL